MRTFASLAGGIMSILLLTLAGTAQAATFVYVSHAEDGDIGTYTLLPDGSLLPGARVEAGKPVMPMSVSPDRRFLYAAVRSKPFTVITYAIDPKTGALTRRSGAALAESLPYIAVDKTGHFLLGASYGGHLVSVNTIAKDGKVSDPTQVIPTARNAHSIITDNTNRFVFVPHLGTDQIFQFRLDAKAGRLTANTPQVVQMKAGPACATSSCRATTDSLTCSTS
jgi:6-phosphogluconolactonase